MYSLVFSLALLGQAEIGVPPAPAVEVATGTATESAEELRVWLLARLVIDSAFDEKKSAEAQRLLASMNERQLNALVAAYKERTATPRLASKPPVDSAPSQASDQATLNLRQAEAFRDHLKREYDRRILQGQMTQNLVSQNIVNNQMMMYRNNGPFSYGTGFGYGPGVGPLGYGGLGYGVLNYGGLGYGAPVYGGSYYGAPGW